MKKLFIEKSILVNATASIVWDVLTNRENTDQWTCELSSGGPRFHIESDWEQGSPVLWKDEVGRIFERGTVTVSQKEKLLRFTVFDVRHPKLQVAERDGITYELTCLKEKTLLKITEGDFFFMADGRKLYELSARTWDRILPRIKNLAEGDQFELEQEERQYLIGS